MIGRHGKYTIRKTKRPAEDPSGLPSDANVVQSEASTRTDLRDQYAESADSALADSATVNPLDASESEDLADPTKFFLPSIPIEPTRPIHSPPSWSLPSGDDLIDIARDSVPEGPNPAIFKPRAASVPDDHLTKAIRTEFLISNDPNASAESEASDAASAPDFPITEFAPFAALAEPDIGLDGTAPAHTQDAQGASELNPTDTHVALAQVNSAPTDTALQDLPGAPSFLLPSAERVGIEEPQPDIAPPYFRLEPEPETRVPNFGNLLLLVVIVLIGSFIGGLAVDIAFQSHLWGAKTIEQASTDVHFTLASMAILYLSSFALALFLFPVIWHKPFFAALQWNVRAAFRYRYWLFAAACLCFVLAMVDQFILPGPNNAPIDKMFSNTTAAWLLFGFGVTAAPFFEELAFRGFLLPALCTTCDWIAEYVRSEQQWLRPALVVGSAVASSAVAIFCQQKFGHHRLPQWAFGISVWALVFCFITVVCGLAISWLHHRYQALGAGSRVRSLGPNGHPQWSLAAMIIGSLLTSLPFAAMHADQIANSLGPLLLLYCVSLVLCFARLATRSLAASTFVHASYNLLLFSLILWGTGGFKHLDKM